MMYRSNQYRQAPKQKWRYGRLAVMLIVVAAASLFAYHAVASPAKVTPADSTQKTQTSPSTSQQASATKTVNECAGNTLSQELLVSISKRHLWACAGATTKYDSAVVTGQEKLAADLTPTGTYHVYSKQTDLYLNGSDSTGSWHDYVHYWMPWLSNKYGIYGFHDATWRKASAFGNISPNSSDASHGCVELPLATAKWVYDWAPIGTTVKIVS
jgi:hypothetical protein